MSKKSIIAKHYTIADKYTAVKFTIAARYAIAVKCATETNATIVVVIQLLALRYRVKAK